MTCGVNLLLNDKQNLSENEMLILHILIFRSKWNPENLK